MKIKRRDVERLVSAYNRDPERFSDQEAEKIAQVARQLGLDFEREGKFFSKLAFDLADTGLLGLIPNEWRPESRGESVFGQTTGDKWATGLGTAIGLAPALATGYGAFRGAKGLYGIGKAKAPEYFSKAKDYAGKVSYKAGQKTQQASDYFKARNKMNAESYKRGESQTIFGKKFGEGRGSINPNWRTTDDIADTVEDVVQGSKSMLDYADDIYLR